MVTKQWTKTRFGEAPFKEVKLYTLDFSGPKSMEDTATVQYHLLLNENVLQAHLDFPTKKAKIIVVPGIVGVLGFDLGKLLTELGLKYKLESEETISYEHMIGRNNTF